MNAKQLDFEISGGAHSQCALIEDYLKSRPFQWVSLPKLYEISGSLAVATRISNLNAPYVKGGGKGPYENTVDNSVSPKKSFYRYAPISE